MNLIKKYVFLLPVILLSCNVAEEKKSENFRPEPTVKITDSQTIVKPAAAENNSSEEKIIQTIIKAFRSKDEKTLNALIDPQTGFYVRSGPGVLPHFEKWTKVDFSNPLMEYHKFGAPGDNNYSIIRTDERPAYDCETFKWNKTGLFLMSVNLHPFNEVIRAQAAGGEEPTPQDKAIADKLDPITTVVFLTEKDADIIFGFAKKDGRYILTWLDLFQTYCDI